MKNKRQRSSKKEEIETPPIEPFHKIWPYGLSWEVKHDKKVDTNYAYFSYEDDRQKYIDRYLKKVKGIKKFKTKPRSK